MEVGKGYDEQPTIGMQSYRAGLSCLLSFLFADDYDVGASVVQYLQYLSKCDV